MKALVLNAVARWFDFENVNIAPPIGREVLVIGVARPDVDIGVNIAGQKRVQGVNFGSTDAKCDIPMYAVLCLQGRMNLDDLVSKRISLREVNEGYGALKDGSLTRVFVTSF